MKFCPKCKEEKPLSGFKEKANLRCETDRYSAYCVPCLAVYKKEYRAKNIDAQRAYQSEWWKNKRGVYRREAVEKYGGKCKCCGEDTYEFLAFDHVNNDGAAHRKLVGSSSIVSWLRMNNYPDTIQLLCHNCNNAKASYGQCPGHQYHERLVAEVSAQKQHLLEDEYIQTGHDHERAALIEKVEEKMKLAKKLGAASVWSSLFDILTYLRGGEKLCVHDGKCLDSASGIHCVEWEDSNYRLYGLPRPESTKETITCFMCAEKIPEDEMKAHAKEVHGYVNKPKETEYCGECKNPGYDQNLNSLPCPGCESKNT